MKKEELEQIKKKWSSWKETAAQMSRNADYYRNIVVEVGKLLGKEAYTADDGNVYDEVLCAKVVELVKKSLEASQRENKGLREVLTAHCHVMRTRYQLPDNGGVGACNCGLAQALFRTEKEEKADG